MKNRKKKIVLLLLVTIKKAFHFCLKTFSSFVLDLSPFLSVFLVIWLFFACNFANQDFVIILMCINFVKFRLNYKKAVLLNKKANNFVKDFEFMFVISIAVKNEMIWRF